MMRIPDDALNHIGDLAMGRAFSADYPHWRALSSPALQSVCVWKMKCV
jgi:hypothetical protein